MILEKPIFFSFVIEMGIESCEGEGNILLAYIEKKKQLYKIKGSS